MLFALCLFETGSSSLAREEDRLVMEFSEKINSIPSSGIISVGISTGQRCGLFQILTKQDEPISAEELAKLSDCKERLVHVLKSYLS